MVTYVNPFEFMRVLIAIKGKWYTCPEKNIPEKVCWKVVYIQEEDFIKDTCWAYEPKLLELPF